MTNYPDSHGEVYCVEADPSVMPQKGQPI